MVDEGALREHLRKLLSSEDAHVGFERAVAGVSIEVVGVRPEGGPHSIWQLVEHLRLAQADILDFCVNPAYAERLWPDDYWPVLPAPASAEAWEEALQGYRKDLVVLQRMAMDPAVDLFARIPHGTGQTYLRELLLVADHAAYHVGQIVLLRHQLGLWPPSS
ncbi:MAG: DinB family protein [Vicinamibacterales bacterium]|nr:DinB family protein [Vicinamibacterales bacterium]